MKKILVAAMIYTALGLAAGLLYREATKHAGPNGTTFTGDTELSVTHTHLLVLGMVAMLLVLALDKLFGLSHRRSFTWFFWIYQAGLVITVTMMVVIGLRQIKNPEVTTTPPALAGVAGLGHMLLTVALALLFVALYPAVTAAAGPADTRPAGREQD